MISIEQVACFTSVYELQSYSAASNTLGKARSTVRERINALEDMMGVTLFSIEGKKAIPSDTAHRLYPRARLLARQSLEFENIALSAYKGELSNITVYHDSSIPSQLLLSIESEIKSLQPSMIINWLQRDRNHCLQQVEDGDALFAIMPGMGNLHPSAGIGSINLGSFHLSIFTATNSTIPDKPVSIAELATFRQLITENDLANELRHTKLSSEFEIVSSQHLLIDKLKRGGWTVCSPDKMSHHITNDDIREVELQEAPRMVRQDCILFYNMSSISSQQESEILAVATKVAKKLNL
ncbi:LysR family transcriptional regulator [Photobacterium sanguinicancri]|uniref:LysR family transcriptional regulator n=1 Tax=Photobacterium sanguinicancri TaxID=875932 RepID=A0AAW7Y2L7_9GAMM|nr:LysR family transcriptional regulator [Photobacterium sanguinicancri]MDO6542310.1 LysR family transcriptional regulator [Photobacterium sanguinicancri]